MRLILGSTTRVGGVEEGPYGGGRTMRLKQLPLYQPQPMRLGAAATECVSNSRANTNHYADHCSRPLFIQERSIHRCAGLLRTEYFWTPLALSKASPPYAYPFHFYLDVAGTNQTN